MLHFGVTRKFPLFKKPSSKKKEKLSPKKIKHLANKRQAKPNQRRITSTKNN